MLRVICLLSLVLTAYSASAPFIKPCKLEDSACIMSSAATAIPFFARGVPELGIKPMDPMKLALINSDQGGLKMVFKDSTLTGLKDCNVESIKSGCMSLWVSTPYLGEHVKMSVPVVIKNT